MSFAPDISPRKSSYSHFEYNKYIKISSNITSLSSSIAYTYLHLSSKVPLELPWQYKWQTKRLCFGVSRKGLLLIYNFRLEFRELIIHYKLTKFSVPEVPKTFYAPATLFQTIFYYMKSARGWDSSTPKMLKMWELCIHLGE
jgi:hypothetical protein